MKIVIEVPEELYINGQLLNFFGCYSKKLDEVIYNGTYYVEAEKEIKRYTPKTPCEDSISRQATLDAIIKRLGIKNETYLLEAERVIYQQILAMPPITPQPKMGSSSENPNKWIPVSERLPEEAGMYLCSYGDDDVGTSYFDIRINEFNILHEQVTAWMPLPKPYKAKKEV